MRVAQERLEHSMYLSTLKYYRVLSMFAKKLEISSVQFSYSVVCNSLWPHEPQHGSLPVQHQLPSLLKLRSIESVIPSNHLILCHPLLLLPPSFPNIMFIYPVSFIVCLILCHGWLWLWSMASLQFNHSPTDGHLGCCRVFALLGGSFLNSPKDST